MKCKIAISLFLLLALGVSSSFGAIGWAGSIWPTDGQTYLPTDNIGVYVQIWKDGCTGGPDPAPPCDSLAVWLYYKQATDTEYDSVAMTFNVFIGNNDEYTGTIPFSATQGGVDENFYCRIYDSTDVSWYNGAQDQNNNDPPFTLHIEVGTSQDVTVTFRVDMACVHPSWRPGGVFFTGDYWGWGACDPTRQMSDPEGDLVFEADFLFPAGVNPAVLYKYNKHDGSDCNWEGFPGNRSFIIDDSSPTQVLPIDVWDYWDCCEPMGPPEIAGPGIYCIRVCYCDEYLDIPLVTPYDPPIIPGILFEESCDPSRTDCDDTTCTEGDGTPSWEIVEVAPGEYVLRLCLERENPDNFYGCFCMTIDEILPVELSTFEAIPLVKAVRLDWTTASEENNDYFFIERSQDQAAWTEIGRVNGAGTTPSGGSYSYVDENLAAGTTYYYRLGNTDIEGARNIYDLIVSAIPYGPEAVSDYSLAQNYPNPFNPTTSFDYAVKESGMVSIKVFSVTGREVATLVSDYQPAGKYSVSFDGTGLPSGIYIYRMEVNDFSASNKMVLLK